MLGREAGAGCWRATLEVPEQRKTHAPTTIDHAGSLLMIARNLTPAKSSTPELRHRHLRLLRVAFVGFLAYYVSRGTRARNRSPGPALWRTCAPAQWPVYG